MRHQRAGVKLSRTSSHRSAMFRNMVTSLFKYDRIRTTDVKAKELSRWAEQLITLAKQGGLHARRQALSIIREKDVVHKLFEQAGERFADRNGGHIRIVKVDRRPGDAAPVSIVELVAAVSSEKKKEKKKSGGIKSGKTKGKSIKKPAPGKKETKGTEPGTEEALKKTDSGIAEAHQGEAVSGSPDQVQDKEKE
ncbi:MAG: 50S ribosomal protein L17 [Thermodesulfobacteriota bacterium]